MLAFLTFLNTRTW